MPAQTRGTGAASRTVRNGARTPQNGPEGVGSLSQVTAAIPGRSWRLWFPARPGPVRKKTRTIAGVKYPLRVRSPELPPSANERLHWRVKAPWVAEWRAAAKETAKDMPRLDRVRISAVIRRRAIGNADEDNDRSRLKPLVDGLRDAGVIANDTRGYVTYGSCTEERAGSGPVDVGVLLIVEEV